MDIVQASHQKRKMLSDDLADAIAEATAETTAAETANLEGVARVALRFVLQASGSQAGILLASLADEDQPYLLVQQGLSPDWIAQSQDASSPLRQAAARVLAGADTDSLPVKPLDETGLLPGAELPEGVAAVLPLSFKSEVLGVCVLLGERIPPSLLPDLQELLPSIGRAIYMQRGQAACIRRTRCLADLQVGLTREGFEMDADALQANLLRGACRVMESRHSALILLDGDRDEWLTYKTLDGRGKWIYQVKPTAGVGLVRECLRSGQPLRVNQLAAEPRFNPDSDLLRENSGLLVCSTMYAPLLVNGQILGVIQVFDRLWGDYDAYDQDLFVMIASLAANALHAARLIQQVKVANADLQASHWELFNSRAALHTLFDAVPSVIYIIDQRYRLVDVNQSCARRFRQEAQSLIGSVCYQAFYGRGDPCPDCRVLDSLHHGAVTQRSARRWGTAEDPFDWEISSYPIRDRDGQIVQAVLLEQDETEKRRLENVLAQSEKLAAIGQLAAGVAHEINNPLTAIIANAQILHRELPVNSDMQESVDLISRAGARATHVVRNLLDFARKEDYHLATTNLNETLQKALSLVQHELMARSVRLSFDPDPGLPSVLASQDHLQSVWLNLLINAIDSLDKPRGEIRITTRQVEQEVHISISDNGKGIAAERLPRIFEPFYTTKAPGRGTGLGLSVSNRIVKQHGGHILVESQIGSGSIFTVALPIK